MANRARVLDAADESIREFREDFDRRIDEIRAELKERGPEAVGDVDRSLDDLKEDMQEGFTEVRERFEDRLEIGRREIRVHPLLAVGFAVAVGAVVGALL